MWQPIFRHFPARPPCFAVVAVFVATTFPCIAEDNFTVSIEGYRENQEAIAQSLTSETNAGLPVVFYPTNLVEHQTRELDMPSSTAFYVLIRNRHDGVVKVEMHTSDWYNSLSFEITPRSAATFYVGRWQPQTWHANPNISWIFAAGSTRVVAVDFCNGSWFARRTLAWGPSDLSDGPTSPWPNLLLPGRKPEAASITATFEYYGPDLKRSVAVSSPPTRALFLPAISK